MQQIDRIGANRWMARMFGSPAMPTACPRPRTFTQPWRPWRRAVVALNVPAQERVPGNLIRRAGVFFRSSRGMNWETEQQMQAPPLPNADRGPALLAPIKPGPKEYLAAGLARCVPPRAGAGRERVIPLDHLHGLALSLERGARAHLARLDELVGRDPGALVPPQARPIRHLGRLPGVGIDRAAAPAVLDQEARRRARIERGHEIVGMPAERRGGAALLARGEIIGLADVVEHEELDHEMMDAVVPGFQHREAVVPGIDVEEVDFERLDHVVAQPQPEHVLIEPQHVLDALDREHDVPHAERPGAESGDGAAGPERLGRDLGAVKGF